MTNQRKELARNMHDSIDKILNLLRTQRDLYGQLESAASKQRELIAGDEPGRLLEVLSHRKTIATELTSISTQLEPVRRDWDRIRQCLANDQRDEAESLLNETQLALQRVIAGDERDTQLLSAKKEIAAKDIRAAQDAHRALDAYRVAPVRTVTARLNEAS